ncbi:hypothetical protein SAMN05421630_104197 [Prauserella marina]|uniref:Uncharacterized protein n=1 Tax=Prauserella marina TaxID=530584 RepID=A0A1G6Q290_9PSEU|nr:hypothetical protein DES30_104197 [Prauserella marina]SDC86560.1 hypothetical protein SAMN05421630_104197 [Prauserella marina]
MERSSVRSRVPRMTSSESTILIVSVTGSTGTAATAPALSSETTAVKVAVGVNGRDASCTSTRSVGSGELAVRADRIDSMRSPPPASTFTSASLTSASAAEYAATLCGGPATTTRSTQPERNKPRTACDNSGSPRNRVSAPEWCRSRLPRGTSAMTFRVTRPPRFPEPRRVAPRPCLRRCPRRVPTRLPEFAAPWPASASHLRKGRGPFHVARGRAPLRPPC